MEKGLSQEWLVDQSAEAVPSFSLAIKEKQEDIRPIVFTEKKRIQPLKRESIKVLTCFCFSSFSSSLKLLWNAGISKITT